MRLTALKKLRALRYLLFKIRAFFGAISAFFAVKTPLSKSVLIPGTYLNHRGTEAQRGWRGKQGSRNWINFNVPTMKEGLKWGAVGEIFGQENAGHSDLA